MGYIHETVVLYEGLSKQYQEEIDIIRNTGKVKRPKQLEEKLKANNDFLSHLYKLRKIIDERYIAKSEIPNYLRRE